MLLEYLNPDCLSLILNNLSFVDQIRFRLTCKIASQIKTSNFKNYQKIIRASYSTNY